jgi:iron complex outermembrane receptor protein
MFATSVVTLLGVVIASALLVAEPARAEGAANAFAAPAAGAAAAGPNASNAGPGESASSPATGPALAEITVTATRRDTNIQQTPISMTVLTEDQIETKRIINFTDLTIHAPSVVYVPFTDGESYISMRGYSNLDDSTGSDQGITVSVDDVPRTSVADLDPAMFDLNRIEVLNGPQGTLFGRNAIGGVIAMYTNDPTFVRSGTAEVTAGNQSLIEARAVYNLPLSKDFAAMRFVVTGSHHEGYIRDVTTGQELGSRDVYTGRVKLLLTPSNDLRILSTVDYFSRSGTNATTIVGNFQPTLFPAIVLDPLKTAQGTAGSTSQQSYTLSAKVDWATTPGTLTSITAYRHLDENTKFQDVPDPSDPYTGFFPEKDRQFSQEIRFASPAHQRLSWLTGLYYLYVDKTRPITLNATVPPNSLFSLFTNPGFYQNITAQSTKTNSLAGFADAIYAVTPKLNFNLGIRYTTETKSGYGSISYANFVFGPAIAATYGPHRWNGVTPKATLTYQAVPQLMLYATASRGFVSGGYNVQGSTSAALGTPFNPEYMWNYEFGGKFDALDHRLQVSISAFFDRYSDLQIVSFNDQTLSYSTTNAGSADVNGLESSVRWIPISWLRLGVQYQHLWAKFRTYVINNGPGVPPSDYSSNYVPFVAPDSVTVTAEVEVPLGAGAGSFSFGADYAYRSPFWTDAANDTPPFLKSLTAWNGLVNARAAWMSANKLWTVQAWGKNLTNLQFVANGAELTPLLLSNNPAEFLNPNLHNFLRTTTLPRTYGLTVRRAF